MKNKNNLHKDGEERKDEKTRWNKEICDDEAEVHVVAGPVHIDPVPGSALAVEGLGRHRSRREGHAYTHYTG